MISKDTCPAEFPNNLRAREVGANARERGLWLFDRLRDRGGRIIANVFMVFLGGNGTW